MRLGTTTQTSRGQDTYLIFHLGKVGVFELDKLSHKHSASLTIAVVIVVAMESDKFLSSERVTWIHLGRNSYEAIARAT